MTAIAHKGRGAVRNTGHRFKVRSVVDEAPECGEPPPVPTVLRPMPARTISRAGHTGSQ